MLSVRSSGVGVRVEQLLLNVEQSWLIKTISQKSE